MRGRLYIQFNSSLTASNIEFTLSTNFPKTTLIRSGRNMQIRCSGTAQKSLNSSQEYQIGTLPESARPAQDFIKHTIVTATNVLLRIKIAASTGLITYTPQSNINSGIAINIFESFISK